MLLELRKLSVPPGHQLLLKDLSWQEFEEILEDLGENRASRLSQSYIFRVAAVKKDYTGS